MKKVLMLVVSLVVGAVGLMAFKKADVPVPDKSFGVGEKVEYRIHYGFINAAEARVDIAKNVTRINNRPCYRINVFGRTTGAFDVFTKVRDTWRTYLDTTDNVPQRFYRNIRENSYRKEETTYFDRAANKVTTQTKDTTRIFSVPDNIHDIISGYYYLRTIDYSNRTVGEIIEVPIFLSDEVIKMRVRYAGRDVVKTRFGRIRVFKLNPLMPSNKMFKGENSIRIWVSDDANKVPIKAEADLFIGALAIDLKGYSGLQEELEWY